VFRKGDKFNQNIDIQKKMLMITMKNVIRSLSVSQSFCDIKIMLSSETVRFLYRSNLEKNEMSGKFNLRSSSMHFILDIDKSSIQNGDEESAKILKIVMNNQKNVPNYYRYISGKGIKGFDAVSCMFAIHYFFESENKLDGFLNNVSSNLKKGGSFFCTFMDGEKIENDIESNGGDKIEGFKKLSMRKDDRGEPIWAIIRCYDKEETSKYNKKINVFIETTGKLIPEYVVSYKFLVDKCKDYGLYIKETEMFSDTFNRLKGNLEGIKDTNENLYKAINELETDVNKDLKRFSSFNRWCIFEKRDE
jgi:hypothetical protein